MGGVGLNGVQFEVFGLNGGCFEVFVWTILVLFDLWRWLYG